MVAERHAIINVACLRDAEAVRKHFCVVAVSRSCGIAATEIQ